MAYFRFWFAQSGMPAKRKAARQPGQMRIGNGARDRSECKPCTHRFRLPGKAAVTRPISLLNRLEERMQLACKCVWVVAMHVVSCRNRW